MSNSYPPTLPVVIFEHSNKFVPGGQCDCDCDCACGLSTATSFVFDKSVLPRIPELEAASFSTIKLNDEYTLCFGPTCQPTVVNHPALDLLIGLKNHQHFSLYAHLSKIGGEICAAETIQNLVQSGLLTLPHQTLEASPHTLTAWLHTTDRCNLRCIYCYLPHRPEDMSKITGDETIHTLFSEASRNGYSKVKIKYAGGEPLLRFETILGWHELAAQLSAELHLELEEVILSNGTLLTPEIAASIKKHGLRLMISLDGLGAAHDVHRHFANGRGSFEQVSLAIVIAQQAGLSPHISVTVSTQNAHSLPELVAWLCANKLHFNLNFARENLYYAENGDQQILIDGMLSAFEVIRVNPPNESILAGLVDRANLAVPHLRTCAVEQDYLVFNARGQLFRCQMEMSGNPVTTENKNILNSFRRHSNPINLPVNKKGNCKTCEWMYWCTGGCPLLTYRLNGRSDVQSPYCAVYKSLYPESFRLEGFRLLAKYAEQQ
ncbi:MAG: radical SAM protein [Anaerolineae bacterium CG_4_9_14_3_um_filter_57_17]|nr:radical SAM protein [bacterium]NCT21824.1 radical SAM protein [bacterium]OIO83608.1 MAG: hypothetical protein AUK01_12050 [Anaerolineae bacterium CG2_30_57_67]PJB65458.1 MAG: radical SAM protein [Anaerolineae bacterium CG_4_9_14_3_um_filter_57_17]